MTWYLLTIDRRTCAKCQRDAEVILMNSVNAIVGYYCRPHGERERDEANKAKA